MNRRNFLTSSLLSLGAFYSPIPATRHLIFIVLGGGIRKKDYWGTESIAPNIRRLARDGFVFEEDHCERVASHEAAFAELLQGRECNGTRRVFPNVLGYIGNGVQLNAVREIPRMVERHRPRIVVCCETAHDVGHESYERYLRAVKTTDAAVGAVFDWIKSHSYFSDNTAIVIRPEFGRDDEVNEQGHLHHSYGFYSTHRVASIFWGPDFNRGVDRKTVVSAVDMAPTLTKLFGVDAIHAQGRAVPGLFKATFLARFNV